MTGTCERRLPPSSPPLPLPPPRLTAPHRIARHDTPMSDDQRQPPRRGHHTDASMRASARTRTQHTAENSSGSYAPSRFHRKLSCPHRSAVLLSPSPSPSPAPPTRASQGRRPTGAREPLCRLSRRVCGLRRRESLYLSPFPLALFPWAVKKDSIHQSRDRRPRWSAVLSSPAFCISRYLTRLVTRLT